MYTNTHMHAVTDEQQTSVLFVLRTNQIQWMLYKYNKSNLPLSPQPSFRLIRDITYCTIPIKNHNRSWPLHPPLKQCRELVSVPRQEESDEYQQTSSWSVFADEAHSYCCRWFPTDPHHQQSRIYINVAQSNSYARASVEHITTLCLRKKRHPFYFCDIFVRFHPILLIFGRNIPQEIWNKRMYTTHIISCFICSYCTL